MLEKLIYHITTPAAWDAAQRTGDVVAESLATEGFIHCSRQSQLLAVSNRFFPGVSGLLVLAIDEAGVAPRLVNEGPTGAGDPFAQDVFPHVYGPNPVAAVIAVAPLVADDDGRFVWPAELPRT
jgi:uncharacterized protein (DUF952 family)